ATQHFNFTFNSVRRLPILGQTQFHGRSHRGVCRHVATAGLNTYWRPSSLAHRRGPPAARCKHRPKRRREPSPTSGAGHGSSSGHSTEDTMKHATRIKALARHMGGIAVSLAHGAAISAGLMGMAYVANAGEGPTRVQFS